MRLADDERQALEASHAPSRSFTREVPPATDSDGLPSHLRLGFTIQGVREMLAARQSANPPAWWQGSSIEWQGSGYQNQEWIKTVAGDLSLCEVEASKSIRRVQIESQKESSNRGCGIFHEHGPPIDSSHASYTHFQNESRISFNRRRQLWELVEGSESPLSGEVLYECPPALGGASSHIPLGSQWVANAATLLKAEELARSSDTQARIIKLGPITVSEAPSTVGTANVFVSWFLGMKLDSTLLDAIEQWAFDSSSVRIDQQTEPCFWICDFCIRQNQARADVEKLPMVIAAVRQTLVILDKWDAPSVLTRAWCLWEIYCTQASGGRLDVAMPAETYYEFEEEVAHQSDGFEQLQATLAALDVRRAQARNPADLAMIMTNCERVGFETLNSAIASAIRKSLLALADGVSVGYPDEYQEGFHLLKGSLLLDQGELREAESILRLALKACLQRAEIEYEKDNFKESAERAFLDTVRRKLEVARARLLDSLLGSPGTGSSRADETAKLAALFERLDSDGEDETEEDGDS